MILYDQDFRFIGMSAETLTFLGYEDIDEFTSMHSDFADLFIKKEGFIHKFENFSWIHYILYSGAANKKAYVSRKNGEEMCVDITIKEVFLNHAYDGLRMIYSVKLINENFTKISHSDVHDNRSAQSQKSEFSLRNLTNDLKIADEAPVAKEAPMPEPAAAPLPEPLDFKLDMPENAIFAAEPKEQSSQPEKEPPFQQTAPLFDLSDTDVSEEKPEEAAESGFTLNFPSIETEKTEQVEKEEEETPAAPVDFATAFAGDHEESTVTPPPLPSQSQSENGLSEDFKLNFPVHEEREEERQEEPVLSFNLAPAAETEKQPAEENRVVHFDEEKRDHEEEKSTDIFSFQLLRERAEESTPETQTLQHQSETAVADKPSLQMHEASAQSDLNVQTEPQTQAQEEEQHNIFNFNFLQKGQAEEEIASEQEKQIEPTPESPEPEVQIPLHDLLKTDTESAPQQEQTMTHEASASEPSTQMQEKSPETQFSFNFFTQEAPEEHQDRFHTAREEELKSTLINQIKHDIEEIDQDVEDVKVGQSEKECAPQSTETEKEIFVKPDLMHNRQQHEENSFEETLKNIFTASQSIAPAEDDSLNKIDTEKPVEEPKQHITTEAIKSPDQNEASDTETLALPKLGSLGLSREEELDFIEEFLDDTAATVGLMQEYLKLEDYSNIKYNLIKISSSAEILHFDQMLEHTKALSAMSDARQKDAIGAKLHTLLQLTERYKAHFSSMPV